ncbi:tetratricopeptide repeat protein, partial [Deinococcus sp. A31D244]|uniref:tetratricopeptide repeat protein n=1 Tax=Deinococcus sp. A31D244 TaxID=3397675 RepID=UPI0039DFB0E3
ALYGAAQALQERGDDDSMTLADTYLKRIIDLDPRSDIAEEARTQRSRIAQANMREAVGGGLRPDALMYILGTLEKFQDMTVQEIQQVALEVAMAGQRGLDVNSSEQQYTLKTMPGVYSGLHMVSIMYAAFKRIDPTMDVGFDLEREYNAARAMLRPRS